MEFLTTKQKKQKARRLFVAYGLLSILVVLATYVLISTALGFDIFKGKDVVQNGLLFVDTRPDNADVYLNGKLEADATNAKYSLPESLYSVRLVKEGYREWNGDVQVIGGTVEFLTYPRLLPINPSVISTQTHQSMPTFAQSRDKRWLASIVTGAQNQIQIYNLDDPLDLVRTLEIPSQVLSEKPIQSSEVIEWAGDNETLLVRVVLEGIAEPKFVLIKRDKPAEFTDLTAMFSLTQGDSIGLWNGKKDIVYVKRSNGAVFIGSTKDKALQAQSLLGDSVIDFIAISNERALYTTRVADDIHVKLYANEKTYKITSTVFTTKKILMRSFGYNRNDYFLIGGEAFEKTSIYRNFEKSVEKSADGHVAPFFIMPLRSTSGEVSRSNRFVMATDGENASVYDIERKDYYRYQLPVERPALLGWFDDVRLYAVGADSALSIMDFDGRNVSMLASATAGIPYVNSDVSIAAYLSNNDTALRTNFIDIETPTTN